MYAGAPSRRGRENMTYIMNTPYASTRVSIFTTLCEEISTVMLYAIRTRTESRFRALGYYHYRRSLSDRYFHFPPSPREPYILHAVRLRAKFRSRSGRVKASWTPVCSPDIRIPYVTKRLGGGGRVITILFGPPTAAAVPVRYGVLFFIEIPWPVDRAAIHHSIRTRNTVDGCGEVDARAISRPHDVPDGRAPFIDNAN